MLAEGLIALASLLPAAHPNSHSTSRVTVRGREVVLDLRCQSASLAEALEIDRDGDRLLSAEELDAGRAAIEGYLLSRYTFEPQLESQGAARIAIAELGPLEEQRVDAHFEFRTAGELERLTLRCRLFLDQNAYHRDSALVVWNDDEPVSFLFAEGVDEWRFQPAAARRPSVFRGFVGLGVEHILTGYDHLAFLLALIVAARRLRSLAGVVTAFTAAHSITLACAALDVLRVPSRPVELAIALSIAYVAAENLLFGKPSARWIEAFGFGLVHGLGFAGFLGEAMVYEPLRVTALVGFNLGVECGQLAVVALAALLLRFLPGDRAFESEPKAWLAPSWLRKSVSLAVAALGLYWFAARADGLF
jgi:hydrogenase/urease accessory protein HupE